MAQSGQSEQCSSPQGLYHGGIQEAGKRASPLIQLCLKPKCESSLLFRDWVGISARGPGLDPSSSITCMSTVSPLDETHTPWVASDLGKGQVTMTRRLFPQPGKQKRQDL